MSLKAVYQYGAFCPRLCSRLRTFSERQAKLLPRPRRTEVPISPQARFLAVSLRIGNMLCRTSGFGDVLHEDGWHKPAAAIFMQRVLFSHINKAH